MPRKSGDFGNNQNVKQRQINFVTYILRSRKSTPLPRDLGKLENISVKYKYKIRMLNFWSSLIICKSSIISAIVYSYSSGHGFISSVHIQDTIINNKKTGVSNFVLD